MSASRVMIGESCPRPRRQRSSLVLWTVACEAQDVFALGVGLALREPEGDLERVPEHLDRHMPPGPVRDVEAVMADVLGSS